MDCAWAGSGSRSMSITVLHILGYRKLPTMAPACIRTGLVRTVPKGDDFLGRIVAMTQTKFETSIKWMPASRFSSSKESAPYTMCCEGDVHCYVWHWWGNTAPGATSKTDGKRCLLLHVPAVPTSPPDVRTKRQLVVQNPIILHDNARSHTAAVTDLLGRWQWEILEHPPYSPDMSPCDYDLFAKVKESLWGTKYSTRDELIRAIERPIRKLTKLDALMVYDAFQTFDKVRNKGATILKAHKCCTHVNKAMTEISNCYHYFLSNPCMNM